MDAAHIHLLLNHVPVLGAVFGSLVLGYGLLRRSEDVVTAGYWLLVLVGVSSVLVYLTGEPAEELVEGLAGVSEAMLERHEEAALWATVAGGVVAVAAALGLVLRKWAAVGRRFAAGVLAAALALCGVMGWTANLGGQVRHAEIRPDAAAAVEGTSRGGGPAGEEDAGEEEEREAAAPGPAAPGITIRRT